MSISFSAECDEGLHAINHVKHLVHGKKLWRCQFLSSPFWGLGFPSCAWPLAIGTWTQVMCINSLTCSPNLHVHFCSLFLYPQVALISLCRLRGQECQWLKKLRFLIKCRLGPPCSFQPKPTHKHKWGRNFKTFIGLSCWDLGVFWTGFLA